MVDNGPDYLKTYDQIQSRKVNWIWYPYIALGKITLLQGDPGDGKSTMMLNLIAELSKAGQLPNKVKISAPIRSLYQCSEDDACETIKPRLESFNANCSNVEFIDEEMVENLTLDDEKIREAIVLFKPQLVVIDPLQSYIGEGCSIYTASRARKLMHNLSIWATKYKCAIVSVEEHSITGGLGSAVSEILAEQSSHGKLLRLGSSDAQFKRRGCAIRRGLHRATAAEYSP